MSILQSGLRLSSQLQLLAGQWQVTEGFVSIGTLLQEQLFVYDPFRLALLISIQGGYVSSSVQLAIACSPQNLSQSGPWLASHPVSQGITFPLWGDYVRQPFYAWNLESGTIYVYTLVVRAQQ